jgi:serine/threonine protein kinase
MHEHEMHVSSTCTFTSGAELQRFARYQPLRHLGHNGCLGAGGFGEVSACWDTLQRRVVVLKIARQSPSSLWVEYSTLLRLRGNPSVPVVYDLFEERGKTCVVMEYLPGCTLDHWLEHAVPGNFHACLGLAEQLCQLLALLSASQLVHNDIKPANLLLCGQRLVLIDFGLAHPLIQAQQSTGGTPGYAPPERVAYGVANAQTDLYSAGCVLAQLFDACVPTTTTTEQALHDFRWSCLETVIQAMLHPDPRFRADWPCVQHALRFLHTVTSQQHCRQHWSLRWRWWQSQSLLRHLRQEVADELDSLMEPFQTNNEPLVQSIEQAAHLL